MSRALEQTRVKRTRGPLLPMKFGCSSTLMLAAVPAPAPAPALSILSSLSVDQVSLLVQSVDPDFTQYAREVRRLKVKGVFISKATDEELSDMFKEMQVSLAHKVELREAVAAWRADPQRALQAVEREGAAEAERQRKIREEEERKAAAKALDPKKLQAAAASRIQGKPNINEAARSGDLSLVQDHLTANPSCVDRRDG